MKIFKLITVLFLSLISFHACKEEVKGAKTAIVYQCPMQCEGELTHDTSGSCGICKMDLKPVDQRIAIKMKDGEISESSIFNLVSKWNTEEGESIQLKELKSKTLVMVMIYTTCKAACPRLVADMRNIEKQIPKKNLENVQFVMVSIDPETDTPTRLKEFAIENQMDGEQWTFLQGSISGVREFANVLAVKYKEISPMDFSHSNIISVFNQHGELVHQQEGLGVDNKETVSNIIETSNNQ